MERINTNLKFAVFLVLTFILAGCANMPTPPSQITGFYVSEIKYEPYSCQRLSVEMNSLELRELQLVLAQQRRIKDSEAQAFMLGYGQGDGLEASELASIRGEKAAVLRIMEVKNCRREK